MRKGPEYDFQVQLCADARKLGWFPVYHFETRGSVPGWPDLTLMRTGRIIFAELKVKGGKLSPHQQDMLQRLRDTGSEVFVWEPDDMDEIAEVLR